MTSFYSWGGCDQKALVKTNFHAVANKHNNQLNEKMPIMNIGGKKDYKCIMHLQYAKKHIYDGCNCQVNAL